MLDHEVSQEEVHGLHDRHGNQLCLGVVPVEVQRLADAVQYRVQKVGVGWPIESLKDRRAYVQGYLLHPHFGVHQVLHHLFQVAQVLWLLHELRVFACHRGHENTQSRDEVLHLLVPVGHIGEHALRQRAVVFFLGGRRCDKRSVHLEGKTHQITDPVGNNVVQHRGQLVFDRRECLRVIFDKGQGQRGRLEQNVGVVGTAAHFVFRSLLDKGGQYLAKGAGEGD